MKRQTCTKLIDVVTLNQISLSIMYIDRLLASRDVTVEKKDT